MTIRELLYKNKKQFTVYLIGILMTTPSNILITYAIANTFKIFEVSQKSDYIKIILVSVLCMILPVIFQLISRYMRIGFMRDILLQVRLMAYEKLMNTDTIAFKNKSKESFQSALTSDINLFEADFFLSLLNITFSIGSFIIGIFVLGIIAPLLAITTLISSLLMLFISNKFNKPVLEAKQQVQKQNEKYHSALSNVLRGLDTIKLYRVEKRFLRTFSNEVDDLEQAKDKSFSINNLQGDITHWFASTYQILAYVYAAYLLLNGNIKASQMVIVINLVGQLTWTMISGFSFVNRFKTSIEVYNKITHQDLRSIKSHDFNFDYRINVNNLSHQYGENIVLNNINFVVNKNEKVLIYGPSGVGKTTILESLTNTISYDSGEINYDDVNLQKIKEEDFWRHVSYVRQDHFMFDDTIKHNIILNKAYDQQKFNNILEQVALLDWVNQREEKENYMLENNGKNVSGGQRQRISLARTLYQDRDLIILDEPSASLDDKTAYKIYDSILSLNKTIICVSHRHLDYLQKKFDRVISLEETVVAYERI